MEVKKPYTPLSQFGEFGLIEHLTHDFQLQNKSSIKGIGDDAAVVKHKKNTVITTDLLIEGVHFDLIYTPLKHLGYKAIVVNLSDVFAMNAIPKQVTVSLAVSAKFSVENLVELYKGIRLACDKYKVDLIGGDTTSSLSGLCISVTALGETELEKIAYRDGAKENDLICVSGNLGGAYMGLQLLEREKKVFVETKGGGQPMLKGYEYVLQRQLKPEARRDIIDFLNDAGIVPTSMIDISDGLSSELFHICKKSNKGCNLFEDKIPIDSETSRIADEMNLVPLTAALNGGEDYELLFTISITDYEKLKDNRQISIIGHITPAGSGLKLILRSGAETDLKALGWNAMNDQ